MSHVSNAGRSRKHSFVRFYPSDWLAGTARLPRLHKSVYFDVCCYVWDNARPCPPVEIVVMLSDLPNGQEILDQLVQMEKLERLDDGSITNARAEAEARAANGAWKAMVEGGRKGGSKGGSSDDEGGLEGGFEGKPIRTKNQEPRTKTFPNGKEHRVAIFEAWNAIASQCDLPVAKSLTDKRATSLKKRLEEHGVEIILAAIQRIPESDFLLGKGDRGWKANFDWLLQPSSMTKLIEGNYHGRTGKQSGWLEQP